MWLIDFSQRGLCYTFNSGKPGHPLRYARSAGRSQAILLLLDVQREQYYGNLNLLKGIGFRVLVHDQNEWPDVENYGIDVSPGLSSTIRVKRYKVRGKVQSIFLKFKHSYFEIELKQSDTIQMYSEEYWCLTSASRVNQCSLTYCHLHNSVLGTIKEWHNR